MRLKVKVMGQADPSGPTSIEGSFSSRTATVNQCLCSFLLGRIATDVLRSDCVGHGREPCSPAELRWNLALEYKVFLNADY